MEHENDFSSLWDIQYQINGGEWKRFDPDYPIAIGAKPSQQNIHYGNISMLMSTGGVTFIVIDCEDRGQHYMNLKFRKIYL